MPVHTVYNRSILLTLSLLCVLLATAQKTVVKGKVYDKSTGEPLPFVNIAFQNSKIGTTSDFDGNYYIETYYATDTLMATYVGYKIFKVKIKKDQTQTIDIAMEPGAVALQEFIVKYEGNPAHTILKHVWENRKANNREKYDAYEYEVYNKIEFDLNNISDEFKKRGIFKKIDFIFDYVDSSSEEKPFLPMFMTESISKYYYRREPKSEKEVIIATKVSGVENKSIQQFLGDMYQNVNIYENNIIIFGKSFVSPISIFGKRYYKYYLTDSGYIDNNYCYKLEFKPRFRAEPVFEGEMWINDTTYAVKQITAKMAGDVNINFINDFRVKQEYVKVDGKYWMLKKDQLLIDFEVDKNSLGIYGRKTTSYKNIIVDKPRPESFFINSDDIVVSDSAQQYDDSFWEKARHEKLSESESNIYHMVDTLKEVPVFKTFVDIMKTAITGYYQWGKIEIGPYFNFYSFNAVEGNRFRIGMRTSSDFSRNIELGAYTAYGTKDMRYKFSGWTKLMVNRKNWQLLTVSYVNDVRQLGVSSYIFQNGNLLSSVQRGSNNKLNNIEQYKVSFTSDIWKGFSGKIILKKEISSPLGILSYQKTYADGLTRTFNNVIATEATFYLRMAWKEKFVETDLTRASIGTKYPIIETQFTFGLKGVLNGDYDYNRFEIAVSDKIYIGTMGYTDWRIEAGKIIGKLPWPLLKIHQGNETYFYNESAFNLMNYFEFISDEYASLNVSHHFDGFFLNKIPLFRKLKWREVANFKALVGNTKQNHTEIMDFLPITFSLKQPYIETGVGIENIFKFFRVDYVWRLSYLNHPNISQYAFRVGIDFKF
jgi:hypothetical protein